MIDIKIQKKIQMKYILKYEKVFLRYEKYILILKKNK